MSSDCNIGSAKAAVFPEPVSARPMMSFPLREKGNDSFWINVGEEYLSLSHSSHNSVHSPSSEKVAYFDWSDSTSALVISIKCL